MVVAVILDNVLPPNERHAAYTNDDDSGSDKQDVAAITITFCGLRTTADRILQSITEDLNFAADWIYFDWVMNNGCSRNSIRMAVASLAVISTFLYLLEAADGRLLVPIFDACGMNTLGRRTYITLMLLVAFEAVPQIVITVLGETSLLEDGCGTEFAPQALANLFSSGYAVLSRVIHMMEYRQQEHARGGGARVADTQELEEIGVKPQTIASQAEGND